MIHIQQCSLGSLEKDTAGLLQRGAETVVGTLWEVETTKTYTGLAGEPAFAPPAFAPNVIHGDFSPRLPGVRAANEAGAVQLPLLPLLRLQKFNFIKRHLCAVKGTY